MQQVTLSQVKAKHAALVAMHAEVGSMIDQLEHEPAPTKVHISAFVVEAQAGEWYAGAIINKDGSVKHHIYARRSEDRLDFDDTQKWASKAGLSAPTIQESRLIVAHHHGRLDGLGWFWTCEKYEGNSAYAWGCRLDDGIVYLDTRSAAGGAVAVRRVSP